MAGEPNTPQGPPTKRGFGPTFYILLIAALIAYHRRFLWGMGSIFFDSRYRGPKPPEIAFWQWLLIPPTCVFLWVYALFHFRERRWVRCIFLAPVVLLILLYVSSSQWHRYIYIAKCYWLPGDLQNSLAPPEHYTGTWRMWHPNGRLQAEMTLRDGLAIGLVRRWHPNGQLRFEGNYVFRQGVDASEPWERVGSNTPYSGWSEWYGSAWIPSGRQHWWDPNGKLDSIWEYESGVFVRLILPSCEPRRLGNWFSTRDWQQHQAVHKTLDHLSQVKPGWPADRVLTVAGPPEKQTPEQLHYRWYPQPPDGTYTYVTVRLSHGTVIRIDGGKENVIPGGPKPGDE